jgi:hypothetical protein
MLTPSLSLHARGATFPLSGCLELGSRKKEEPSVPLRGAKIVLVLVIEVFEVRLDDGA